MTVMISTGSGFTREVWATPNIRDSEFVVGDFDGDGRDDIANYSAGAYPNWRIWHSDGSSFSETQAFPWGNIQTTGFEPDIPLTGDFNNDDIADIALFRKDSYPNWFYRLSNGSTFLSTTPLSWGNIWWPFYPGAPELTQDRPVTGDFNGDGFCDLAIHRRGYGGYPNWFINLNDTGMFGDPLSLWSTSWGNPGWGDFEYQRTMKARDFNADGIDDLAIFRVSTLNTTYYANYVSFSTGSGFTGTSLVSPDTGWYEVFGDVNGDNRNDLLGHRSSGSQQQDLLVNLNNGSGFPDISWAYTLGAAYVYCVGDFNGDGLDDLLVSDFPS